MWRQPLKVTFVGEAGMDSGGVTREWFSSISSALTRGSLDLLWSVGGSRNQLYLNPLSNSPSHLKRFHFVGMFMAKVRLLCFCVCSLACAADDQSSCGTFTPVEFSGQQMQLC